jgi:uncharacterized protein YbjT (DUF2867 family)
MSLVLVTGTLGNVGREVARECALRGLTVRAAGTDEAALRERFPLLDVVQLDFLVPQTWRPALAGCDAVFLLRPPPLGDMKATLCPFVDEAYAAGVKHLVFLSVEGAERNAWVPHRKVELHLMKTSRAWTILRPGFFAQNLQDAYQLDIIEDNRIYIPAGEGRVAFIDAADIGAVAARVFAESEGFREQALTLTGPEVLTFTEVAALLTAVLGRSIRYEAASIPGYLKHLRWRRGMTWMQIAVQTVLHVGLRRGDAARVEPTMERLLGRPARTMKEYIQGASSRWRSG